ncbi:ABC-type branched-subunit amino acid transport system permease subunit [Bradyrhizobium sp. GM6.1]
MAGPVLIPAGDFRTSYAADTTIFPTTTSRNFAIAGVLLLCFAPQFFSGYWLSILIQIGIFSIAALGLNILVGFTGQISIGHAAFFLLGAFTSAYISNNTPIPVFFAIPVAGIITALIGLIFGIPAARLKGLYLVIATLAAQYILLDFFSRAEWFTGGSVPASASPFSIFGYTLRGDRQYFYVVLAYVLASYILVTNLMRTRDGRALVAIRDHYLSAEIMGIKSHEVSHAVVRPCRVLRRHRRRALCALPARGIARGFRHRTFDPVPRHDHHRRHRFDHGHADGHRVRGAAA